MKSPMWKKRHGITAVLRQMGLAVVMEVGVMWLDVFPPELLRVASATLLELLEVGGVGREAEYEADAVGQSLAVKRDLMRSARSWFWTICWKWTRMNSRPIFSAAIPIQEAGACGLRTI